MVSNANVTIDSIIIRFILSNYFSFCSFRTYFYSPLTPCQRYSGEQEYRSIFKATARTIGGAQVVLFCSTILFVYLLYGKLISLNTQELKKKQE